MVRLVVAIVPSYSPSTPGTRAAIDAFFGSDSCFQTCLLPILKNSVLYVTSSDYTTYYRSLLQFNFSSWLYVTPTLLSQFL